MSGPSIAGSLPKGDANGIGPAVRMLIDEPHRFHVILSIIDCKKVTTDNDTGEVVPTARIRRLEVVLRDDLPVAEQLMRRALESRNGRTVLPLDLEDDMRLAFQQIDPRTGERLDGADDEDGTDGG
jgi:hypothetical protein